MKLLVLLISFCSSAAFASMAKFQFNFHLKSLTTEAEVARYECTVTQTLTWENHNNFFKCVDQNGNSVNAKNVSVTIGYDYDRKMAVSIYDVHGHLGLLNKLSSSVKVSNGAGVKLYYASTAPRTMSQEFLVETKDDSLLFAIDKLEYIN